MSYFVSTHADYMFSLFGFYFVYSVSLSFLLVSFLLIFLCSLPDRQSPPPPAPFAPLHRHTEPKLLFCHLRIVSDHVYPKILRMFIASSLEFVSVLTGLDSFSPTALDVRVQAVTPLSPLCQRVALITVCTDAVLRGAARVASFSG